MFVCDIPSGLLVRRSTFLAGKVIQGFAIGMINVQTLIYTSEITPDCLRGPAMALFPFFTLLGQLFGAMMSIGVEGLETSIGYRATLASQWVFTTGPFVLSFLIPESPVCLLQQLRTAAARESVSRLYTHEHSIDSIIERLRYTIEHEAELSEGTTYLECFNKVNRRRTLISVFSATIVALLGLTLLSNVTLFLQITGMEEVESFIFTVVGVLLGLIANGASTWILTKVGRRNITVITMMIAGVLWGAMGIDGIFPGAVTSWFSGVTVLLAVTVISLGAWPASYSIRTEASSLRLRAKTQGTAGVFDYASVFVMDFAMPHM